MHYGDFTWFYDRYWGPDAVVWELPVLEKLLLPELPESAAILEVCCGSGHLARALGERGFSVTGSDLTPEMIELAPSPRAKGKFRKGGA